MSLRILHVIPSVSPLDGGPSAAIALMERGLTEAGVAVTTLTTDHCLEAGALGASLGRTTTPFGRVYVRQRTDFYKVAPGAVTYLARHARSFDVIHIHALFSFLPTVAALIAHRQGVPYIVRPLGTLNRYGLTRRRARLKLLSIGLLERRILERAAAVHFTARAELDEAREQGLSFRGVVVPLGIEDERSIDGSAAGAELRQRYPLLAGRRLVLFLSRIDPKKNLEALIDAFASSPRLQASAALMVAGSGETAYVADLQARAVAKGVSPLIAWLGHVGGEAKAGAFAWADIFALPSHSENFGIAAVEAIRAGLPCVIGKGVAIAGEIEACGGGLAVAPDAEAVAVALERLVADDALRTTMGTKARGIAEREYSLHGMTKQLIELYETVRTQGAGGLGTPVPEKPT